MKLLLCLLVSLLMGGGLHLLLRRHWVHIIVGLGLIGQGVNLALFILGGWKVGQAPLIAEGGAAVLNLQQSSDPLPQALILTAIVIGFAMQAFLLVLYRQSQKMGSESDPELMRDSSR